ncbi:MAG: glucose-1-phosphate thymidylyltransferase RfbA [Alphaproteobacteria bacterium]|nr:glucose-1-phosphate thymidylyltransferase RfbA [Alphaproteobacteria bacterium]
MVKGILLAGGSGTRLYPMTKAYNKQLIAVYDKPLIHYPLATLMLSGIRQFLVITTPRDRSLIEGLLGDGSQWGLAISYAEQHAPKGIAEALIIGRDFVGGDDFALILGDNIFFGHGLKNILQEAGTGRPGATVFGYWVPNPEDFGVVTFDHQGRVQSIEEKPLRRRSHYAVTGLYFYDARACAFASELEPSTRGELEITDVNRRYLELGELHVHRLERGFAWLDAGTPDALLDAANYIATMERRQGLKIGCLEEIAWRAGWIDDGDLESLAAPIAQADYGRYLLGLLSERNGSSDGR